MTEENVGGMIVTQVEPAPVVEINPDVSSSLEDGVGGGLSPEQLDSMSGTPDASETPESVKTKLEDGTVEPEPKVPEVPKVPEKVVDPATPPAEDGGDPTTIELPEDSKPEVEDAQRIQELSARTIIELKNEVAELKAMSKQHDDALVEARLITEEEVAERKKLETASEVEQAENKKKIDELAVMAEQTRLNPEFKDFDKVVSQPNVDWLIENLALGYQKERGGSSEDWRQAVHDALWGQTNPYRYAYGMVMKYHPDFKERLTKPPAKPGEKTVKEPVTAPPSVSSIHGGGDGKSGWTASRIDNMTNAELSKVPPDVYEKWLQGKLPE